jgi:hypothetical protein
MDDISAKETDTTAPASITVLSVTPIRVGKLVALAAVEVDIDGVPIEIDGVRALHVPPAVTRIELPTYRHGRRQGHARQSFSRKTCAARSAMPCSIVLSGWASPSDALSKPHRGPTQWSAAYKKLGATLRMFGH